jgi:hypothetical protein
VYYTTPPSVTYITLFHVHEKVKGVGCPGAHIVPARGRSRTTGTASCAL